MDFIVICYMKDFKYSILQKNLTCLFIECMHACSKKSNNNQFFLWWLPETEQNRLEDSGIHDDNFMSNVGILTMKQRNLEVIIFIPLFKRYNIRSSSDIIYISVKHFTFLLTNNYTTTLFNLYM